MKTLLKKSAILKTISSKSSTYLHTIDADPQEDDSDFDDKEWMDYPTKPTLAHVILNVIAGPFCPETAELFCLAAELICQSSRPILSNSRANLS